MLTWLWTIWLKAITICRNKMWNHSQIKSQKKTARWNTICTFLYHSDGFTISFTLNWVFTLTVWFRRSLSVCIFFDFSLKQRYKLYKTQQETGEDWSDRWTVRQTGDRGKQEREKKIGRPPRQMKRQTDSLRLSVCLCLYPRHTQLHTPVPPSSQTLNRKNKTRQAHW